MKSDDQQLEEIRYCKKCHCELSSTNTHKLCDNCRRLRAKNIRNVLGGIGGAAVGGIIFFFAGGKHNGGMGKV